MGSRACKVIKVINWSFGLCAKVCWDARPAAIFTAKGLLPALGNMTLNHHFHFIHFSFVQIKLASNLLELEIHLKGLLKPRFTASNYWLRWMECALRLGNRIDERTMTFDWMPSIWGAWLHKACQGYAKAGVAKLRVLEAFCPMTSRKGTSGITTWRVVKEMVGCLSASGSPTSSFCSSWPAINHRLASFGRSNGRSANKIPAQHGQDDMMYEPEDFGQTPSAFIAWEKKRWE